MKKKLAQFDAAAYLDNEEVIAEYLNAALEDENPDVFLMAIGDVAKLRGMAQLAKDTGLGRESLYKALAPGAKPRYDTVLKLIRALGVELHAAAPEFVLALDPERVTRCCAGLDNGPLVFGPHRAGASAGARRRAALVEPH